MNAIPPRFPGTPDEGACIDDEERTGLRWAALAEAGAIVAALGGVERGPAGADEREFATLLGHAEGWRRERAKHGVTAAIGPLVDALAEFAAARTAVLALLPSRT